MNIKENVTERFLKYVQIMTPSDDASDETPSSRCQFLLANKLVSEMKAMGITDAYVDGKCYVYGSIPASKGYEDCKSIGFIAHMDTVSDYTSQNVKPIVHKNYNGEDLPLNEERILTVQDFPHLPELKGRSLITASGDTILGSDDKAGVAEILCMAESLLESDQPHGKICIAFTPDEEIGRGADYFDVKGFGADYAYTVDGGEEGCIEYENFNAASAEFFIRGKSVHPGDAKDVMINASLLAMEINAMLGKMDTPAFTCGYEGFYHLCEMEGDCAQAHLYYIVRDHDLDKYFQRLDYLRYVEKTINLEYGEDTVSLQIKESYRNMKEQIKPHMHLIDRAILATKEVGVEPMIIPIRGGTDGARLSYMGLPCPNLGTGGYAFHGPYEHITCEGMESVVKILLKIVEQYANS